MKNKDHGQKKGLEQLKRKRKHRKWKYSELKKKLLRRKPTWNA